MIKFIPMNYVIAKLKNGKDAASIAKYVRKFNGAVRVINEDELEDRWMMQMINEAEEEGGEIPEEEILQILKQNGS